MPVVTVVAPAHVAVAELVAAVAASVADVLSLGPGDVIAMHVPSGAVAASGGDTAAPWPVVTIHGSDRGSEMMDRACVASADAVRTWADAHGVMTGGVWSQWSLPRPAPAVA